LQYTIEARELTNEFKHRPASGIPSGRITLEASDADAAITQYVRDLEGELVSVSRPARGQESIATVKKEDAVFLVRIYQE
jgi:YD repeat-containing protein